MSAIGQISINDGASTPVTHVFHPISTFPPLYRENQSGLALVGQGVIQVQTTGDSGSGLNKVRVVLALPALETVSAQNAQGYTAAPKVAYTNKVDATFILPNRGTAQQRKDLRVLMMNALANAQIVDSIDNLAPPY